MSTVAQRLEERETLSFTAQTVEGRWLTIIIVPQGYDKDWETKYSSGCEP